MAAHYRLPLAARTAAELQPGGSKDTGTGSMGRGGSKVRATANVLPLDQIKTTNLLKNDLTRAREVWGGTKVWATVFAVPLDPNALSLTHNSCRARTRWPGAAAKSGERQLHYRLTLASAHPRNEAFFMRPANF